MSLNSWQEYVKQCPKQNILDAQDGDVFYLEQMNKNKEDNTILSSKFRPGIIVSGRTLLKHPKTVAQFSHDISYGSLYVIPLTTKTFDKRHPSPLKENDINLQPYNIQYDQGKITFDDKPTKGKEKASYTHPFNMYEFSERDIDQMFEMEKHHDPQLNQRKIGHINQPQMSQLLDAIGESLQKTNQGFTETSKKMFGVELTHMQANPTRLSLKMHNPIIEKGIKPAFNDPDIT